MDEGSCPFRKLLGCLVSVNPKQWAVFFYETYKMLLVQNAASSFIVIMKMLHRVHRASSFLWVFAFCLFSRKGFMRRPLPFWPENCLPERIPPQIRLWFLKCMTSAAAFHQLRIFSVKTINNRWIIPDFSHRILKGGRKTQFVPPNEQGFENSWSDGKKRKQIIDSLIGVSICQSGMLINIVVSYKCNFRLWASFTPFPILTPGCIT